MQNVFDAPTPANPTALRSRGARRFLSAAARLYRRADIETLAAAMAAFACSALLAWLVSYTVSATTWAFAMTPEVPALVLAVVLAFAAVAMALDRMLGRLPPRVSVGVAATLFVAALAALPLDTASLSPAGHAITPAALAWAVARQTGLPVVALTVALVFLGRCKSDDHNRWDARAGWGLAGALVALAAYPIAVEPAMPLDAQIRLWMLLFVTAGLLTVSVLTLAEPAREQDLATTDRASGPPAADAAVAKSNRLSACLRTTVLAALVAAAITEASATIAPLALVTDGFLIVVLLALVSGLYFDSRAGERALLAMSVAVIAAVLVDAPAARLPLAAAALFGLAANLGTTAVRAKVDAARLVAFASGGLLIGALGLGQLVTSVAPLSLALVAALAVVPGMIEAPLAARQRRRLLAAALLATAVALAAAVAVSHLDLPVRIVLAALVILPLGMTSHLTRFWPERRLVYLLAALAATSVLQAPWTSVAVARSSWTSFRVTMRGDTAEHRLQAGPTMLARHLPSAVTAADTSSLARAIASLRRPKAPADREPSLLIGIVGLGGGTLACLTRPGDVLRYFEPDAAVARLSADARWFPRQSRCAPDARIALGDPGQTLAHEPDDAFDLIIFDATAMRTPPLYLVTTSALTAALRKLAPDGILALRLGRDHMDLGRWTTGVVGRLANVQAAQLPGDVVLVSRSAGAMDAIATWPDAEGIPRRPDSAPNERFFPADLLSLRPRRPRD